MVGHVTCAAMCKNLSAIMVSLSREAKCSDIKAAGLLQFVMNVKFVGTLLMCELPLIDRFS